MTFKYYSFAPRVKAINYMIRSASLLLPYSAVVDNTHRESFIVAEYLSVPSPSYAQKNLIKIDFWSGGTHKKFLHLTRVASQEKNQSTTLAGRARARRSEKWNYRAAVKRLGATAPCQFKFMKEIFVAAQHLNPPQVSSSNLPIYQSCFSFRGPRIIRVNDTLGWEILLLVKIYLHKLYFSLVRQVGQLN